VKKPDPAFPGTRHKRLAIQLRKYLNVHTEEAFQRIQHLRPGIPTILMSGYSEQEALNLVNSLGLVGFLQKPFKLLDLSHLLQRLLAAAPERPT
jgi:DNA-binding NtrC family response regulator